MWAMGVDPRGDRLSNAPGVSASEWNSRGRPDRDHVGLRRYRGLDWTGGSPSGEDEEKGEGEWSISTVREFS